MDREPRSNPCAPCKLMASGSISSPGSSWKTFCLALRKFEMEVLWPFSLTRASRNQVICSKVEGSMSWRYLWMWVLSMVVHYNLIYRKGTFLFRNCTSLDWKGQKTSKWEEDSEPPNFYRQEASRENHSAANMGNALWNIKQRVVLSSKENYSLGTEMDCK